MSYHTRILEEAKNNTNFRTTLFTGELSQLVVMDIKPGEDIGAEVHAHVEQTLFFLEGEGKAFVGGEEYTIGAGDVVVVTPGTKHNFLNTGSTSLKVYTVYAPPNHIDGRIHKTKAEAQADLADEEFGEQTVMEKI
ncbi:MAG: cupin domain-containing protein [Patescibacteria group bacterium]